MLTSRQQPAIAHPSANPEVPVTDWLPLPEVRAVEVLGFRAAEVETETVSVVAVIQFSGNRGWSTAGTPKVITTAQTLTAEVWEKKQGRYDIADSDMDGMTHCRLAVRCTSLVSSTVVPFTLATRFNVVTRQVQRVPFERMAVVAIGTTPRNYRLTGPVPVPAGSFKARVWARTDVDAHQIATEIRYRPLYYADDSGIDLDWGSATSMNGVTWDASVLAPRCSYADSTWEQPSAGILAKPFHAYGLSCWSSGSLCSRAIVTGVVELYED